MLNAVEKLDFSSVFAIPFHSMDTLHYLYTEQLPIFDQLRLEEALLRADSRNWCLINKGTKSPAVVMGISGQPERDLNLDLLQALNLPVIRRYSGGGTVVVDSETVFVSLIAERSTLPFPCYPRQLMTWSGQLYAPQLAHHGFAVRENDYVLGDRKWGGNAQSITKDRFVHHSTLLWDYSETLMDILSFPHKVPEYREKRTHRDFVCRLKDVLPDKQIFIAGIRQTLEEMFVVEEVSLNSLESVWDRPHRKATCKI